jgi:hypothetical protein
VSTTNGPVPKGFHRTVILFEGRTSNGQDLFIRGGIDEGHRQGNVVSLKILYYKRLACTSDLIILTVFFCIMKC